MAYRLLGDPSAAEDTAAEAFERAYAQWRKVEHLPYRDAWVMRVTANIALSALRRKHPQLPAAGITAEEDATATRMALVAALRALPRRQREVIVLHHLGGAAEAEVARALGISMNTVKTHLQRGMAALRSGFEIEPVGDA